VIDIFENERNVYQTPYHLEGNIRSAGFVDIQVRNVKLIMGTWGEGNEVMVKLIVDPALKDAGNATIGVFTGVVDPLLELLKAYWPHDDERAELAKVVKSDCVNDAYHLYLPMYGSYLPVLITGLSSALANRILE
jgi:hypothetical protein